MKWFNAEKILPKQDGYYLVKCDNGIHKGLYTRSLGVFKDPSDHHVIAATHWRPMGE